MGTVVFGTHLPLENSIVRNLAGQLTNKLTRPLTSLLYTPVCKLVKLQLFNDADLLYILPRHSPDGATGGILLNK